MMDVATLVARAEVTDLLTRLTRLLDDRRFDDAAEVYAAEVEVRTPRARLVGLEQVVAFLRDNTPAGERSQHVVGDVLVSVEGDTAELSANVNVHFYRDGQEPFRQSGLRSNYRAFRTGAGWRLTRIETELRWMRGEGF